LAAGLAAGLEAGFAAGLEVADVSGFFSLTGPDGPGSCQSDVFKTKHARDGRLTLGALEDARLLARGKSAVDVAVERGLGGGPELVVGLDVLLDGLATKPLSATFPKRNWWQGID
jgi:hypothetical protein